MSIQDQIKKVISKVKAEHTALLMKKLDLVPVIFANGEDDDVPGLLAAYGGARFLYQNKIYEPSEDATFNSDIFGLTRIITHTDDYGNQHQITTLLADDDKVTLRVGYHGRVITFIKCRIAYLTCARM